MDSADIDRVVEILEDDAFRRGGAITLNRLLALAAKYRLSAEAIVLVKQRLHARNVGIEYPDDENDDAEVNDGEQATEAPDGDTDQGAMPSTAEVAPREVQDILAAYLRDAAKFRLLTPQEESALARRVCAGRAAAEQLAAGPTEHQGELLALVEDGECAKKTLIEANLRLVPFVARSLGNKRSLAQEDLIQEGNLGLIRAAEKFDAAHETRFSTYACWWIWSFMQRAIVDRGQLVRLPVHLADRAPALLRMRAALARERAGAQPSAQELAEHLGWPIKTVQFVLQYLTQPLSIDSPAADDQPAIADRLSAPPEAQPDVATARREEHGLITALVDSLGGRLAFVLKERFGLADGVPRTLEEIGEQLGVTRERIRQIEVKALRRLRHPSRSKLLRDLIEWAVPPATASEDENSSDD